MSKKKYYTITDNNYDYLLYDQPDNKIIYNDETHLVYNNDEDTYHNGDYNRHYETIDDSVYHSAHNYMTHSYIPSTVL
jgi:hypothetical protein